MKLPSLKKCEEIVKNCDAFYKVEGKFGSTEYKIFNYRLATYEDFIKNGARELRGITFVKNNGVWERIPMLPKFWNLNENEGTAQHLFENEEIDAIQNKEDGSLITFVPVGDDFVAKTKMSFDNDQTKMANEVGCSLKEAIKAKYKEGVILFFELVSPKNKIVLKYPETKLILISGRKVNGDEATFLSKEELQKVSDELGVSLAPFEEIRSLKELIKEREYLEDKEGWVIRFKNGEIVKLKTLWYLEKHKLREDVEREDAIIKMVLEETIDDFLAELEGEEKDFVNDIVKKVTHKYDKEVKEAYDLLETFKTEYKESRKDFALKYNKHPLFGVVMKSLNGTEIPELVKQKILKDTSKLEKAREFLSGL